MKILTPGHRYELANFEQEPEPFNQPANANNSQVLQFIQKEPQPDGTFKTVLNGTTNEEVLAMLIDRLKVLGAKLPSRENSLAVTKLEEALMWLNKRTAERKARGVEGTPKP